MRRLDRLTGRIMVFVVFVAFTTLWLMQFAYLEGSLALGNALVLVMGWMILSTLWRKAESQDPRAFSAEKAKRTQPADMAVLLDRLTDSLTPEERAYLERRLVGFDDEVDDPDLVQSLSALLDEREQNHQSHA